MANISRLDQHKWLNYFLSKNEPLIKDITFYKWPEYFNIPYFNSKVSLSINGKLFDGFGINQDRTQSILIALSEALERYHWFTLELHSSTNGYANHFSLEEACKASINEIIERDLCLSHFLTKIPYIALDSKKYELPNWTKDLLQASSPLYQINFFQTHTINNQTTVICKIDHRKHDLGPTFGSKSHFDIKNSLVSSLLDALSSFHLQFIQNKEQKSLLEEDLSLLYLKKEYSNKIDFLFNSKKASLRNENMKIKLASSTFSQKTFSQHHATLITTYPTRKNPFQNLYKGVITEKSANFQRLKSFSPSFKEQNINILPNPFF